MHLLTYHAVLCRYDLWYDQVPHLDRHNRRFLKPWHPLLGP